LSEGSVPHAQELASSHPLSHLAIFLLSKIHGLLWRSVILVASSPMTYRLDFHGSLLSVGSSVWTEATMPSQTSVPPSPNATPTQAFCPRDPVASLFSRRCAVTRMQLRLVEACHILPVAAPNSPDHVTNGIALSPTYHRAFDTGLIYLDPEYTVQMNLQKKAELQILRLTGGLADFENSLGRIHLPADRAQWPHTSLIRKAIRFRGIQ